MRSIMMSIVLTVVAVEMALAQTASPPASVPPGTVSTGMHVNAGTHPRLFFSAADLPALRQKARASACFTQLVAFVEAYRFEEKPGDGRGFASNPAMVAEAFVALITQEPRHIEKAKKQLLQAAGWDVDIWRDGNYQECGIAGLGLGHFSRAVGTCYDWLYPFLTEEERVTVRDALSKKVFAVYKKGVDHGDQHEWWLRSVNNWCPVIQGGVGIFALATLGEAPEADWLLGETRKRLRNYLDPFPRDGGCFEGVAYGIYGVSNAGLFGVALQHVIGTDDGILEHPGIKRFGSFLCAFTGADDCWVNFSDCQTYVDMEGELYALVERYQDRALDAYLQRFILRARNAIAFPWEIIFRPPGMATLAVPPADALKVFPETQWAAMRSETMQLFFKSGNIGDGHKHADLNTFALILNGERLAPTAPYANRDTRYHSTIVVNGSGQVANSTGTIVRSGEVDGVLFATADAGKAYGGNLSNFLRTIFFVPDCFVAIGDVLQGPAGNKYEWKLQTSQTPLIAPDQKSALISGKKAALQVQVVLPDTVTLSTNKSFGPCLSADVAAAGPMASYFVVLAPANMSVSAKAMDGGVRVIAAGKSYTFVRTDNGWKVGAP